MTGGIGSAWWQLLRAGNVFTAVSNILAGFLLARGGWHPTLPLLFLILSSATLYLAGMVLNDVFDLEIDRVERPERPLPAGRIDPRLATIVGWGLLFDGLTAAGVAAWLLASWLPIVAAMLLAMAIMLYDRALKHTGFGPLTMGACRSLNILLGASAATSPVDWRPPFLYACAIGCYTVGLTLLARDEATEAVDNTDRKLQTASRIMLLGLFLMLLFALLPTLPKYGWFAAWLLCFLAVRVHLYEPIMRPSPATVQKSVSRLITMFIPLDALACAAAGGWTYAVVVLTLLLPTYIATRRTPMT